MSDGELREAELAQDTDAFLAIQKRQGAWRDIPAAERTIQGPDGEPYVVEPGVDVPWSVAIGTRVFLCLDVRRGEHGVEYALGDGGLPVVTWAPDWRLALGWGGARPHPYESALDLYERGVADAVARRGTSDQRRAYLDGYAEGRRHWTPRPWKAIES